MNLVQIGTILKKARQKKALTIQEIAKKTQISLTQLQALEEGDDSKLPAKVYIKGFIKSYGKTIDFDTQPMLDFLGSVHDHSVIETIQPKSLDKGFRKYFDLVHIALSLAIVFFVSVIVFMRSVLNKYEAQYTLSPALYLIDMEDRFPSLSNEKILSKNSKPPTQEEIKSNPLYLKQLEKRMGKHIPGNVKINLKPSKTSQEKTNSSEEKIIENKQ